MPLNLRDKLRAVDGPRRPTAPGKGGAGVPGLLAR